MKSSTGLVDLLERLGEDPTGISSDDVKRAKKHFTDYGESMKDKIVKLWKSGSTVEQIVSKTGQPNEFVIRTLADRKQEWTKW